ncbi:phosphoglucosamine mutase [Chloroflexota bacterium]
MAKRLKLVDNRMPNKPISGEGTASGDKARLFGTSGIRGVVNQDLSIDFCREVAQAIGTMLSPGARVCIGTDTRITREIVKDAVVSGLCSSGIDVIDFGIIPTPVLAFLTGDMGFDTGVMITASHNPPEFNGIKLFNGNYIGYSMAQELEIESTYYEKRFRAGYTGSLDQSSEAKERYFRFMLDRFSDKNFTGRSRIIVDPGNGAASRFAGKLLSVMGCNVISLNDEPDGFFPGRDPEPKEETLEGTVEFLKQQNADLAICFDGDADRVVFCDREGFLGFNEMIAFVSRLVVEEDKKRKIAATVETGRLLELSLNDLGAEVVRGRVGDVNVAYLAKELDAVIGVEPIGVYIMPEAGYYPDSMFAALTLLSKIRDVRQIRHFFKSIPRLFLRQRKLRCSNYLKATVMERLKESTHLFEAGHLNTLDGLRLELDDSWMLIRTSGTEPAIRVITESTSKAEMEELLGKGVQAVENLLEKVAA